MPDSTTHSEVVTIVVTVVCTLAGVVVTLFIYWRTRRGAQKALTFDVKTVELGKFANDFEGKLNVSFAGEKVDDASLVGITFKNTGGVPIEPRDISEPIRIGFSRSKRIVAYQMSESSPDGLSVAPERVKNEHFDGIMLLPTLLNPGDRFTILVLVSRFDSVLDKVIVTGRIAGVKSIDNTTYRVTTNSNFMNWWAGASGLCWAYLAMGSYFRSKGFWEYGAIHPFVLATFLLYWAAWAILKLRG